MNEIKSSIKRTYTRLTVLGSVVAFTAIAIAQGQKGKPVGTPEVPKEVAASVAAEARPIPLMSSPAAQESMSASSEVRTAAVEMPVSESPATGWGQAAASDPVSPVEPPPLLPDEHDAQMDDATSDLPATQRQNPYRSPGQGVSAFGPTDSALQATESAHSDATEPAQDPQDPLSADSRAALPNTQDTHQTLDDPPQLPEPAAPSFDPAPAAPPELIDQSSQDLNADTGRVSPEPMQGALDGAAMSEGTAAELPPNESFGAGPEAGSRSLLPDQGAPPSDLEAAVPTDGSQLVDPEQTDRFPTQTTGKPGPQNLEGPQTPSLTVEKLAPPEIQVGLPAKFQIRVRNVGRVTAEHVLIRDEIPVGTNFIDANPKATRTADGAVYWEAGSIAPGDEFMVSMDLMPVTEGQLGSVATVSFQASATARSHATKPELVLEHTGPKQVLVGEPVRFAIKLSNPGSGAATKVVLQEDVPPGLSHSSGTKLEYEVGRIEPGQTRQLELTLKAAQPGQVQNTLIARADAGLLVKNTIDIEVVAPKLQVGLEGPSKRYLDRQATFTVSVANPGTAPAHEVELVAQLPAGLKFVSTNNSGYYDQSRHAVVWSLQQLPAGEMGKAQFTALPTEMGEQRVHAEGKAQMGLESTQDLNLTVEGISALLFSVADQMDPIEVGGQTVYEVKVTNQGSKAATNVSLAAMVPEGMQPVGAQGPTAEQIQGQRVMFGSLSSLGPKQDATFRITVQGDAAGDHRFRVQLTSDEMSAPVMKEESTRVYSD